MEDARCPHCRNDHLVSGTCVGCGWSFSHAVPVSRRPALPARAATGPDCWVLLLLAAAITNFFLPILCRAAESPYPVMILVGIVVAQMGVLSVVAALGSSPHAVRLPVTLFVAALLLVVLFVGGTVAAGDVVAPNAVRAAGGFLLVLPALLLSAQAPLWLYRGASGRRLAERDLHSPRAEPHRLQFGIAQMLLATALIAVSLTLARGGIALGAPPGEEVNDMNGLIPFVIVCIVLALGSALVTLPCTWAMLVAERPAAWVVPVLSYGVLAPLFVLLVGTTLAGGGPPQEELAWLGVLTFSTFAATLAGLGLIRKSGFALMR